MKPLTTRTYCRCSLTLPLLVPLLEILVRWAIHPQINPFDTQREGWDVWLSAPKSWLGVTLVHGGIPYALLVVFLLYKMRGKSPKEIRHLLWISPYLMFPVQVVYTWLSIKIDRLAYCQDDIVSFLHIGILFSLFMGLLAVFVASIYVLIVQIGFALFRKTGLTVPGEQSA